jgi:hypothetical protein
LKAATKKQKYDKINEKKLSTPIEVVYGQDVLTFELMILIIYLLIGTHGAPCCRLYVNPILWNSLPIFTIATR